MADDTIAAISTPPGRGGIGIVRLSGAAAKEIAEVLVRLKRPLEAGRARFGVVIEADSGAVLDEAVVTYFQGPRSYTGEDVVEIAVHGAPVLLDALVGRCVAAGARLAEPGEFTQRGFLAGRIDLTQAEAVDDLIQATTLEQARTAARQMGGGLSRQVRPVKERLIGLIAAMEAGIDFAEDDLEVMGGEAIRRTLRDIEAPLVEMEESFAYGRVMREGFKLAIVGRPNAGKSSLFNRLVRRERAIVTAQPGTTRDPVAERLEFAGIPVEMVDTAGLRVTNDEAEAMGVAKSREAMAEADVVLLVVAADAGVQEEDLEVMRGFGEAADREAYTATDERDGWDSRGEAAKEAPEISKARCGAPSSRAGLVVVVNKIDLAIGEAGGKEPGMQMSGGRAVVETSAVTGTGVEALRTAVLSELKAIAPGADTAPVTNMRQHQAIGAALGAVRAGMMGVAQEVPHEMVLIDLHEALGALDALTGTTHTEEILGVIFSKFCVGK